MKSPILLLVLFVGLYETKTKTKTKHYLVKTADNPEDGSDYQDGLGLPDKSRDPCLCMDRGHSMASCTEGFCYVKCTADCKERHSEPKHSYPILFLANQLVS